MPKVCFMPPEGFGLEEVVVDVPIFPANNHPDYILRLSPWPCQTCQHFHDIYFVFAYMRPHDDGDIFIYQG